MNDDNIYTVKTGDTFWTLENEWKIPHGTLQKLNPNIDPYRLQVGENIVMPNLVYIVLVKKGKNYCHISPLIPSVNTADNLYGHNPLGILSNIRQHSNFVKPIVKGANNVLGGIGTLNAYRRSAHLSNEIWHLQKNGILVHRWKEMSNGASYWKNNIVSQHRKVFQTLAKSREIAPGLMKWGGLGAVGLDIFMSGELKPSQAIATALVIGSYFV